MRYLNLCFSPWVSYLLRSCHICSSTLSPFPFQSCSLYAAEGLPYREPTPNHFFFSLVGQQRPTCPSLLLPFSLTLTASLYNHLPLLLLILHYHGEREKETQSIPSHVGITMSLS